MKHYTSKEVFKKHKKSGYFVSNRGRVKGKLVEFLKLTKSNSGYFYTPKGLVHRMVYETFVGEIPKGYEIDHIDFNKANNTLENLEAVTRSENQKRSKKSPNRKNNLIGENNPCARLKEKDVLNIYGMIKSGKTNKEIGDKFYLHDRYVSLIRHGKRWQHLHKHHFSKGDDYVSLGNNYLTLNQCIDVITMIMKNEDNTKIAKKHLLDKTTISKVRNKRIWKQAWKEFYKRKN